MFADNYMMYSQIFKAWLKYWLKYITIILFVLFSEVVKLSWTSQKNDYKT